MFPFVNWLFTFIGNLIRNGIAILIFIPLVHTALLLVVPFYFLKKLTLCMGHCMLGHDFTMSPMDTVHLQQEYSSGKGLNVMIWQGECSLGELRCWVQEHFTHALTNKGEDFVPHVWSYPLNYMGYYFWRNEHYGNIEEHVFEYPEVVEDEDHLRQVIQRIHNEPFPEHMSPWLIILVRLKDNEAASWKEGSWGTVLRMHHCLGDGMSQRKLFITRLAHPAEKDCVDIYDRALKKHKPSNRLLQLVLGTLSLPREFLQQCMIKDSNSLHGPKLSGDLILQFSQRLDLKLIKDIKNKMNCTTNYVFIAAVAGAIRRIFFERDGRLPDKVHALFPVMLRPRTLSDQYRNDFSIAISELCIHEDKALDRLRRTKSLLDKQAGSLLPVFYQFLLKHIIGYLPSWLSNRCADTTFVTIGLSNFLMTDCPLKSPKDNQLLLDMISISAVQSRQALAVSILSYNGSFRISVTADRVVMDTEEEAENFLQYIEEEIHTFHAETTREMYDVV